MAKFSVSRAASIDAPVQQCFDSIRDFKEWPKWSPWLIAEPDCALDYADDGTSYRWKGKIIGSGEMEVLSENPNERIDYRLTFFEPWKSVSEVSLGFAVNGSGSDITWTMQGSLPFFLFWMKRSMEAFIGMDYERGLNMFKDLMERGSVPSKLEFVGEERAEGCPFLGIRSRCALSEVGPRMESDFGKLAEGLRETGATRCGDPFSVYHKWEMVKGFTEYTIGVPVERIPETVPSGMVSGERPSVSVFSIKHTGPYRHLGNAWAAGMFRARSKVFKQNKRVDPFEIYRNRPEETPEEALETTVCFPIA